MEKQYKCLIWGIGAEFEKYINLIHYQELLGNIKIVGVTSAESWFKSVFSYPFIKKEELSNVEIDIVLVASDRQFMRIRQNALDVGFEEFQIINCRALELPYFNFQKYISLLENPISIFANNCWGGLLYHRLALPFTSPFVNMFERDEDYIKILKEPQKYMKLPLKFEKTLYNETLEQTYPVCSCGDALLYFNHYASFEEANEKWEQRKQRINWDNVFVMMRAENKESEREFHSLPYDKRICFVPFASENKMSFEIEYYSYIRKRPFFSLVNGTVQGKYKGYSLLDLLCDGCIKKVYELDQ